MILKLILNSCVRCSFLGLIYCLSPNLVSGQSLILLQSSPFLCINSYSQKHAEVFSLFDNPALLMKAKKRSIGVYNENKYLTSGLVTTNICFASCVKDGSIGLNIKFAGNTIYNESELGFSYAKKMFNNINVGMGFQYEKNAINAHFFNQVLSSKMGLEMRVSSMLSAGFSIQNPFRLYLSKERNEAIPYQYSFSIGYDPVEQFFFGINILKTENIPIEINTGLEYIPNQKINYRIGVFPGRHTVAFGIGFLIKKMVFNLSLFSHQQLGLYPGIFIASKGK